MTNAVLSEGGELPIHSLYILNVDFSIFLMHLILYLFKFNILCNIYNYSTTLWASTNINPFTKLQGCLFKNLVSKDISAMLKMQLALL